MVVVLPAPFGPSRPKHSPARHLEVEAVDGDDVAVALDDPRQRWPTQGNRGRQLTQREPCGLQVVTVHSPFCALAHRH